MSWATCSGTGKPSKRHVAPGKPLSIFPSLANQLESIEQRRKFYDTCSLQFILSNNFHVKDSRINLTSILNFPMSKSYFSLSSAFLTWPLQHRPMQTSVSEMDSNVLHRPRVPVSNSPPQLLGVEFFGEIEVKIDTAIWGCANYRNIHGLIIS